jgi:hypothetical protein
MTNRTAQGEVILKIAFIGGRPSRLPLLLFVHRHKP